MQPLEETLEPEQRGLEPITAADRRLIALSAAVILFCVCYLWYNYRAAFPQASIELKLGRGEITARAEAFLRSRGWKHDGFLNLTLFDPDDEARLFLERETGLEKANALMRDRVPVWRWRARWYKPPEREEFRVIVAPDGRVAGFDHLVPEQAAGDRLSADEARRRAEEFLHAQTNEPHRVVEQESEQRPNRVDHVLTFEREGFDVNGAAIRRAVTLRGGEVAAYSEYLKIPEQWQRDFAAMRSKNELYTQAAQALYMILIAATMVLWVAALRRHAVDWGPVILICGVVGGLMTIATWNLLPFLLDARPTSTPIAESVALAVLEGLGAGVGVFLYVALAAGPGEAAYRREWPDKLRLGAAVTRAGVRTREFFRGCVSGYAMAAGHLVFVTAFYLLGQKFGVWAPQDVDYSNLLSTALPWIYPLTISAQAASAEEFWFRLLAIPLLLHLTRGWRWSAAIAIVLPAMVWGFLHSNYPQQPAWIRGVEVGLIGIVAGWMLLRFGIVATLVWHYTVDAALIGSFLLQSGSLYFRLSGAIVAGVVLLPLAMSAIGYWRRGGFVLDAGLSNAAKPVPEGRAEVPVVLEEPLPPRWPAWYLYAAAAIAVAGGLMVSPARYGDFIRVTLTRQQAIEAAGPAGGGEMVAAQFEENLDAATFECLRRQAGRQRSERLVAEHTTNGVWRVRYFRPGQKEERWVYVNREGRAYRTDWILDEKSPGANLTKAEAQEIAERYLRGTGVALETYEPLDHSAEKREKRTDHQFVWEHRSVRAGEARARISLRVLGDQPSEYRRYIFLPESFLREFRRTRLAGYALPSVMGGLAVMVVLAFLRNVAHARVRWWACGMWAVAGLGLFAVTTLNGLPSFYLGYDTSKPLSDYVSDRVLSLAMWGLLLGLLFFLAALAVEVVVPLAHGVRRLPSPSAGKAAALGGLIWGWSRISGAVEAMLPGDRRALPVWSAPDVESWSGGAAALTSAFAEAFAVTVIVALVAAGVIGTWGLRQRLLFAGVTAVAIGVSRAEHPVQFLYFVAGAALVIAAGVLVVRTCGAGLWSLGVALFALGGWRRGWEMYSHGPAPDRMAGVWVAVLVALICAACFARGAVKSRAI